MGHYACNLGGAFGALVYSTLNRQRDQRLWELHASLGMDCFLAAIKRLEIFKPNQSINPANSVALRSERQQIMQKNLVNRFVGVKIQTPNLVQECCRPRWNINKATRAGKHFKTCSE